MRLGDAIFRIVPFGPASPELEGVLRIYRGYTPYSRAEGWHHVSRHAREADFRGWAACVDDEVVGMAFGARIGPGNWWWDAITAGLGATARDLDGAWTLSELAVAAGWRRRGIATTLLRVVEGSLPEGILVLSTGEHNTAARALYQSCGWEERATIRLSGGGHRSVICVRKRGMEG